MKNESRDLAKYFQAHRDDEGEWQDSAEPAVIGRSPSVVYSLRLAAPELAELRRAANARGLSLSELIRNAALQHVRESNVSSIEVSAPMAPKLTFITSFPSTNEKTGSPARIPVELGRAPSTATG